MPSSTLTSKGQTTLPKEIRDVLHLQPGDRIEYVSDGTRVYLAPATMTLEQFCALFPPSTHKHTVAEMNEAIRKRAAKSI